MEEEIKPLDIVRLKSGSNPMTVSRVWIDERYESRRQYATLVYANDIGTIEKINLRTDLLKIVRDPNAGFPPPSSDH